MSLAVRVTITGDAEVQRKLRKIGDGIHRMPEAMKEIGQQLSNYYATTGFTDRGRPYNQEWAPLAPRTMRRKEKLYGSSKPLINTGQMQRGFYAVASDSKVTIDNRKSYYKYHQSAATRYVLPRRQMAGINNPVKKLIKDAIRNDIAEMLRSV